MGINIIYLHTQKYMQDKKQKNIIKKQQIKNIVWIGSFIERKRPKFFIELAKEFTNLNFYMIGDGELFDDINNYVEKHNIKNVNFLGRIQNYEVYKNLKNIFCYFLFI